VAPVPEDAHAVGKRHAVSPRLAARLHGPCRGRDGPHSFATRSPPISRCPSSSCWG
jgi:hypothetical protein